VVHTHTARDAWIFGIAARLRGIPILDRAEALALDGFTFERVVETYMEAYRWVTGRHS
jgi:hypothetical protein